MLIICTMLFYKLFLNKVKYCSNFSNCVDSFNLMYQFTKNSKILYLYIKKCNVKINI